MTTAHWCIFITILLPYVWTITAKRIPGGAGRFNNAAPRDYLGRVKGMAARANWAQLNAFEALPPFIAAVLIAEKAGVAQGTVDNLAIAFVIARVGHGLLYLADRHLLRSLVWGIGLACVIALFILAACV